MDKRSNLEYSLQYIYGSGIHLGGTLSFKSDGTFSKYIGVSYDDPNLYEGKYYISENSIFLEYRNGRIEKAIYLPDTNEIEIRAGSYPYNIESLENVFSYFVKK
jgi:hypothetical protein